MATLTNRERKARSKARRQRKRAAQTARHDAALAIACPVCTAGPGVHCFLRAPDYPDMHERRYRAATDISKEN